MTVAANETKQLLRKHRRRAEVEAAVAAALGELGEPLASDLAEKVSG